MPVDSMATVVTPHDLSQSARISRSAVQVPKQHTLHGRLLPALPTAVSRAFRGGASWTGTHTQCCAACTSMPAACGWVMCSASVSSGCAFFDRLPCRVRDCLDDVAGCCLRFAMTLPLQ